MESVESESIACALSPAAYSKEALLILEVALGESWQRGGTDPGGGLAFFCVMNIPDILIPRDIVRFFELSLSEIVAFRVFRHLTDLSRYVGVLCLAADHAAVFLDRFHKQQLSSVLGVDCELRPLRSIQIQSGSGYALQSHWLEFLTDADWDRGHRREQTENFGDRREQTENLGDRREQTENFGDRREQTENFGEGGNDECAGRETKEAAPSSSQQASCPLCLDVVASSRFMTFCRHAFHLHCVLNLESPQCPVCRFEHDSLCQSCTCCVCNTDCDLWLCLLCGLVACGESHGNHIRGHYADSQHTYAMHLGDLAVWDFSGEGFVDRLLLGQQDGGAAGGGGGGGATKLIEHSASHSSAYRAQLPISDVVQEDLVQQKVSSVLGQYNRVLAWRMQQNRLFYEDRIRQVRSLVPPPSAAEQRPGKAPARAGGAHWRHSLRASLQNEAANLRKQCDLLRQKLQAAYKEREVQEGLRAALLRNQEDWAVKVAQAEQEYAETVRQTTAEVQAMQERLQAVLARLEGCES